MNVRITGGSKHQREIVYKVIEWTIKRLKLVRMSSLYIYVVLKKLRGVDGYCSMEDDTRRIFTIEIHKNLKLRQLIMTLIHEMVHVKQFARNEMDDFRVNGRYRWKSGSVPRNVTYYDMPWEKEALRLQEKLTDEFWREDQI
tara:strand:- start:590 stop:1015 length:426 start_codon:yes stop_codon:yes gene_type:complete